MSRCKAKTKSGSQCKNDAQEGSAYCHLPSHQGQEPEDPKLRPLTEKQERFCQNFVSEEFYGNGVQSYIDAYNIDLSKKGAYDSARAAASENLTKLNICHRINELLDEAGLNDNFVDKQLLHMITQHADYSNKMRAIEQYNKIKGRITHHLDHTSNDEKIKGINFNIVEGKDPSEIYGEQPE